MRKFLYVAAAVVVISGFSARAGTEAGKREILFQGSVTQTSDSETDNKFYLAMGSLVLNYFIVPQFSIGLSASISGSLSQPEGGDESKDATVFLMGRADLYLTDGSGSVVPYLGGHGGGASFTSASSGTGDAKTSMISAYGGQAGFKIFPTENTSWSVEGNVTMFQPETEESATKVTIMQSAVLLGFSYYF